MIFTKIKPTARIMINSVFMIFKYFSKYEVVIRGVTRYRYTGVSRYVWPWFDNRYGNAENRFFRYGFKIKIHLKWKHYLVT
jgi:hypothetical protein